jgi:hypothetical protein
MPFEHVSDRLVRNVAAQIRQGTGNPVVPPTAILLSHSDNESFHVPIDSRPAGIASAPGSIELLCDQLSIPSENGVGFGYAGYSRQRLATESFPDLGERRSLQIRKTQTRWQLRPQDPIFSGQIFVLKEQFLIDQTGYVGQATDPAILFHAEGP